MSWSFLKSKLDKPVGKDIYFIEDIYEELEKRTGKKREVIEEVVQINFTYLKKSLYDDPKTILVRFPNLGLLKFNEYLGFLSYKKENDVPKRNILKDRMAYIKTLFFDRRYNNLKIFNKPIVHIATQAIKENDGERDTRPSNLWSQFYKYWYIIQNKHNEEHAKYFKK